MNIKISFLLISMMLFGAVQGFSENVDVPTSFPPFSIAVDILKDGDLIGVGTCDVRIGVNKWKDRIYITEFSEGLQIGKKSADYVNVYPYLLEIVEIKNTSLGRYSLVCKDYDSNIYKGFLDFAEVKKHDSKTWDKYKMELRTIDGKLIRNISKKGRQFKKKYIPKVSF